MAEQMTTLESCGLAAHADAIYIGVNGGEEDGEIARMLAPDKAKVIVHGEGSTSEITTMNVIRGWVTNHPGWNLLYFHAKGVSHPDSPNTQWRINMEAHCLHNWRMCVFDLDSGYDAVGSYWLTPEEHKGLIKTPFFGGTYWWAKSDYLATLPALPAPTFENRYDAEGFIGSRIPRPRVKSYIIGWPPQ
jgi:hypothetical protein